MGVLDDKVAIVTGSGARHRPRDGRAARRSTARRSSSTTSTPTSPSRPPARSRARPPSTRGDLTKASAPDELVQTAIDAWGKIDIIVNNAGYTLDAPIHKMSDDWFQRMLDIHVVVPFRVIRAAAPAPARAGQEGARGGRGGLPQDRQRLLDLGHDGQRRPGQLLGGQERPSSA